MSENFEVQVMGDLPPGIIAQEARQLEASLSRAGLAPRSVEGSTKAGERGVLTDLGKLVLEHTVGPIGEKLLDGLKQYFVRDQSVVIDLTRPDGQKIRIEAKNVGSAKVKEFLGLAKDALG